MKWTQLPISEVFVLKQGTYLDTEEMVESRTGEFPFAVYGANGVVGYSKRMMYAERTPLISCRGANCGVVHFTEPNAWVGNNSIACIPKREVDPRFFFYKFSNSLFTDVITGSAQPQITLTNLSPKLIVVPPITVQHTVGDILSTYDDLIENNRRRMGLLEKAARLLYEEWFVRLRFPGHEHTPIQNGLPQGWERKRLDAVAEINRASFSGCHDGEIEYVDISAVMPGQITETSVLEFRDAPSRARRIVKHGDIIWSCVRPNRRSYAVIWNPPENLIVSTGFAVITPTLMPTSFLYFATTTGTFVGYLENHAKGAAYPAVVAGDFGRASIVVPTKALLKSFDEVVKPIFNQIHNLHLQNQALRAARDLLLPRLMSGEIEV